LVLVPAVVAVVAIWLLPGVRYRNFFTFIVLAAAALGFAVTAEPLWALGSLALALLVVLAKIDSIRARLWPKNQV